MSSPADFFKGVGKGTKGLLFGVGGGVVTSATNVVGTVAGGVATVGKNVASITGDDKYLKRREEKRRELKANQGGVLEGLKAGGESIVTGFSSGITGLVTKPFEEGSKAGAFGFIKGLGQGIVGVAVKPVIGVSEGISNVVQGINQQISDTRKIGVYRPARAFYRRDNYDDTLVLVPIDFFAGQAQKFVKERGLKKDYGDRFLTSVFLGFDPSAVSDDTPVGLALSEKYLFLLSKVFKEKWNIPVPSISYVQLFKDEHKRYGLKFIVYEQSGPKFIMFVSKKSAVEGYKTFYRFRFCFGQPNLMLHVQDILPTLEGQPGDQPQPGGMQRQPSQSSFENNQSTHSNVSSTSPRYEVYEFGKANRIDLKLAKMENVADSEFMGRYNYMMKQTKVELPIQLEDQYEYHKHLDESLWRIISNWVKNHESILSPSRCCGCLILNYSSAEVQIIETSLSEGGDVATFGIGQGFNHSARSIEPFGGAAIVFATGKRPTLLNLEHVKVVIKTTAFKAMVATRENRSSCEPVAGFNSSFLEKSRTDWWAKYVIVVK